MAKFSDAASSAEVEALRDQVALMQTSFGTAVIDLQENQISRDSEQAAVEVAQNTAIINLQEQQIEQAATQVQHGNRLTALETP